MAFERARERWRRGGLTALEEARERATHAIEVAPSWIAPRRFLDELSRSDLLGVEAGRDYSPRFADIRESREGDRCPVCRGALRFQVAIEVGHIFKFSDRYSTPLGATFLDEDGSEKPLIGGSYGVGPARVMAAAVEQHHDENGIVWPASIAPYDIHVLALHGGAE